jgi:hypothetical protein
MTGASASAIAIVPTAEQAAIIDAACGTKDNLLISALAGAAKTSTLVMIAAALKTTPLLCLSFNKRIALEMADRLPGNCEAMTLNSLGHRIWTQTLGKRLVVDTKKNYNIIKGLADEAPRSVRGAIYDNFSALLKALEQGKILGYVPDGKFDNAKPLVDDEGLFGALDEEPTATLWDVITQASFISIKQAWAGLLDYSDQILLPGIFPVSWPSGHEGYLVDETQDLSVLNHVVLRKLVKSRRLIAVGDDAQSIYAFRGAHPGSMDLLREEFAMKEMLLSISFRCPERIVREAQWRAPHMQWAPANNGRGQVETLGSWGCSDLPDRCTILCRNNAPLFGLAFKLLKAGRNPQLSGNDVGKSLVKTMKKFGRPELPRADVEAAIYQWQTIKLTKSRNEASILDQAQCMRIFAEQGETLADAIAYAEHILAAKGPVVLMTIHKSKGLEFDHVILLDRFLIRTGRYAPVGKFDQQEDNLLYVAQTRTKNILWYANTEYWT